MGAAATVPLLMPSRPQPKLLPRDLRRPARHSSRHSPVIQLDLFGHHHVIFQDERRDAVIRRRDGASISHAPTQQRATTSASQR